MNEQNENMELEVMDTAECEEPETVESGGSGFAIGLAIGAGLAVLVGAGVKKAKTVYAKYKDQKSRKRSEKAADEVSDEGDNVVPIAQEDDKEEE